MIDHTNLHIIVFLHKNKKYLAKVLYLNKTDNT